jgi:hypothetical protein
MTRPNSLWQKSSAVGQAFSLPGLLPRAAQDGLD